jgi:uncharacterized protein YegP (UPF0339 family)
VILLNKKYQVYRDVAGKFRFRLRAENNQIVAVSEGYENHAGVLNGVKSVQSNCGSGIEDMTIEGTQITNPKYQVFYDKSCGYRFHLKAKNGEIIAVSEGYETKQGCINGIEAVRASCNAEIEDLTVKKPDVSNVPEMKTVEVPSVVEPEMKTVEVPSVVEPEMKTVEVPSVVEPEILEAPVCEDKELKLELYDLPASVAKDEIVYFKGKIRENCQGKGKISVSIREHDRSFFFDKVLARGYAEEDGSFTIGWRAQTFDFWDNKGEIYAQYDRAEKPKHIRSEFKNIVVK